MHRVRMIDELKSHREVSVFESSNLKVSEPIMVFFRLFLTWQKIAVIPYQIYLRDALNILVM